MGGTSPPGSSTGSSQPAAGDLVSVFKRIWQWFTGSPSTEKKQENGEKPPPEQAKTEHDVIKEDMVAMRKLLQRMGAALAAAAGAILAGLGWTQVHQAFPFPALGGWKYFQWEWLLWVLLVGGSFAAFGGAAWLASRFFAAQRRIVLSSKRRETEDLDADDRRARDVVYRSHAAEELAPSLHQVELRGYRLERVARRLPDSDPQKKLCADESNRLFAVVDIGMRRAGLAILETRSRRAFSGNGTMLALGLTIVGVVLVFGVADYAKGQRDLIDLRSKCQEAVNKGASDACDPVRSKESVRMSATEAAAKKRKALADLEALRSGLPKPVQRQIRRLEACTALLSANDALSGAGEQAKAAIVQACESLLATGSTASPSNG